MKAVADIEFILSAFLFVSTISFITLSIIGNLPVLQEKSLAANLQSTSYQMSELLLDKGYPTNWHLSAIDDVARIGLESDDYVLDSAKVSRLSTLCENDYNKLRAKMMNYDFMIIINGSAEILNCEPPVVSLIRPQFVTTRHAVYNGNPVDLIVVVLG
jgi:hypothetical protein